MGFKELTDVVLSSPFPLTVNGVEIEAGEPIAIFQRLQSGSFGEIKDRVDATGGYNNASKVSWESTKQVDFNFTQGVLSKIHLALTSNSILMQNESVAVPTIEKHESDENSVITLKHNPIPGTLFIYSEETGEKLTDYTLNEKLVTITQKYLDVQVVYSFNYSNASQTLHVGRRMLNGYLELSGKTRLKDDETGKTTTGIIRIPRLKLMSDLSIRLGVEGAPTIGSFTISGIPTGPRGQEQVLEFIMLSDDIDSDI